MSGSGPVGWVPSGLGSVRLGPVGPGPCLARDVGLGFRQARPCRAGFRWTVWPFWLQVVPVVCMPRLVAGLSSRPRATPDRMPFPIARHSRRPYSTPDRMPLLIANRPRLRTHPRLRARPQSLDLHGFTENIAFDCAPGHFVS